MLLLNRSLESTSFHRLGIRSCRGAATVNMTFSVHDRVPHDWVPNCFFVWWWVGSSASAVKQDQSLLRNQVLVRGLVGA